MNSIVPGNYSSNNTPIPYEIANGQLTPPYELQTVSGVLPVDDYNRTFPGNFLNATNRLFTQCWTEMDAQV